MKNDRAAINADIGMVNTQGPDDSTCYSPPHG